MGEILSDEELRKLRKPGFSVGGVQLLRGIGGEKFASNWKLSISNPYLENFADSLVANDLTSTVGAGGKSALPAAERMRRIINPEQLSMLKTAMSDKPLIYTSGEEGSPVQWEKNESTNKLKIKQASLEIVGGGLTMFLAWWVFRLQALMLSLMASLPAWRDVDLLPILHAEDDDINDIDDEEYQGAANQTEMLFSDSSNEKFDITAADQEPKKNEGMQ